MGRTIGSTAKIVVAALSMTVALLLAACSGGSAESVAEKAIQAYADDDAAAYYDTLAPDYRDYMVGKGGWFRTAEEFQEDAIQDSIDELRDDLKKDCGDDCKVTVAVESVHNCSESDLSDVKRELQIDYGYDGDEITGAAKVDVSVDASGAKGSAGWVYTVSCVEVNGSWYVHRPGFDSF